MDAVLLDDLHGDVMNLDYSAWLVIAAHSVDYMR